VIAKLNNAKNTIYRYEPTWRHALAEQFQKRDTHISWNYFFGFGSCGRALIERVFQFVTTDNISNILKSALISILQQNLLVKKITCKSGGPKASPQKEIEGFQRFNPVAD